MGVGLHGEGGNCTEQHGPLWFPLYLKDLLSQSNRDMIIGWMSVKWLNIQLKIWLWNGGSKVLWICEFIFSSSCRLDLSRFLEQRLVIEVWQLPYIQPLLYLFPENLSSTNLLLSLPKAIDWSWRSHSPPWSQMGQSSGWFTNKNSITPSLMTNK